MGNNSSKEHEEFRTTSPAEMPEPLERLFFEPARIPAVPAEESLITAAAIARPLPGIGGITTGPIDWPPVRCSPRRMRELPASTLAAKRAADIILAASLLVLLGPVMLTIAAILAIQDGPILYRQVRVGRGGRLFVCYKFRTMRNGADEVLRKVLSKDHKRRLEWHRKQKLKNDPRITTVGSWLRKTSLDELPQLVNVIKGDMSLVGPRPILPEETRRYHGFIVYYLSVKPGLTGLWQVSGRNNTTYPRRVALDVAYVRNLSLLFDFAIILRTIPALLKGEGAR